jgi:putative zinc finger/helix-turn-helix YgiT family protein
MTEAIISAHECSKHHKAHTATRTNPYHFIDSGLPNVYLIGVKYWVCEECQTQHAEIPAPEQLMNVIAESIVMKSGLLSGAEIKFLRKRVGKRAADFAELVNKTPEHFSKLETGSLALTEPTDKLIRLTYGMLSGDQNLLLTISTKIEQWLKAIHGVNSQDIQIKKKNDDTWVPLAA